MKETVIFSCKSNYEGDVYYNYLLVCSSLILSIDAFIIGFVFYDLHVICQVRFIFDSGLILNHPNPLIVLRGWLGSSKLYWR